MKATKLLNRKPVLCILLALLAGCNNGIDRKSQQAETQVNNEYKRPLQEVVISRISTVPVNNGNVVLHALRVDNHTGFDLHLVSAEIENNTLGNDSALGCNSLYAGEACSISITPLDPQASTTIKLTFKNNLDQIFKAAQLVNYSSTVASENGFIAAEDQVNEIYTTNDYSLTIPFIADDDYEQVTVKSEVMLLSKHLDCIDKVAKGTHCTANLTLPVPSGSGYNNEITIEGKTALGKVNRHIIHGRTFFENRPALILSGGPLSLLASNASSANNSVSLRIVNNTALDAIISDEEYKMLSSEVLGTQNQSNVTSALSRRVENCGFTGSNSSSIGNLAPGASSCEIVLSLSNIQQPQSGHDQYSINYYGEYAANTKKSTYIYYTGLTTDIDPSRPEAMVDYAYKISGNLNFTQTQTNLPNPRMQYIQIQNTGRKKIKFNGWNVTYPQGMQLRNNECIGKTLDSAEACNIFIGYKPVSTVSLTSILGEVKMVRDDNNGTQDFIAPNKKVGINYSAQAGAPSTGVLTLSHGNVYLEKEQGVSGEVTEDIVIENSGNQDYTINQIASSPGLKPPSTFLKMEFPATFNIPGITNGTQNNPLNAFSLANNLNTVTKNIVLKPKQHALIRYRYGNGSNAINQPESGTVRQQILRAGDGYSVPLNIGYATTTSPIRVTTPKAVGTLNTAGNLLTSGGSFPLTWGNKLKVEVEYAPVGGTAKNFIVDDNDLPYGYRVVAGSTTCPTSSKSSSPTNLTVSCKAVYEFLNPDISNSYSYTLTTNSTANQTFKAPPYSLEGADKKRRKVTPSQSFTYQTKPFATITTSQSGTGTSRTVTFRIQNYDAANLAGMQRYPIVITPDYTANSNITATGATSCVIDNPAANASCSITFKLNNPSGNKQLPVTYASTEDAYYNSIRSSITLN